MMNSLIIPVYKNESTIPDLIQAIKGLSARLKGDLEVIFAVDGSPDQSAALLSQLLPESGLRAKLLLLSRNFGSFAAIRTGLTAAEGEYLAVMAADLQEPPELLLNFFHTLQSEPVDVVIGTRETRDDPFLSQLAANGFWLMYKKFVVPDMPHGGVDVFGCNRKFRDHLVRMEESHSSLVAQLFWMGFRRKIIGYTRLARPSGKSAWTFKKRFTYLQDSIFSFTDLPIRILTWIGVAGILFSVVLGCIVILAKLLNLIPVPGYAATVLVVAFFGAVNILGLGIVGTYAWRTYENTKRRPLAICTEELRFPGGMDGSTHPGKGA